MLELLQQSYPEESYWDNNTIILYLFITALSVLFASLAQLSKKERFQNNLLKHKPNLFFLSVSFAILFVFSAFRDVGTDLPVYRNIFETVNNSDILDFGIEPGFVLINKFLNNIGLSRDAAIAFFSFITLLLIYKAIYRYGYAINWTLSIFALSALFYFQSYNLMRMYLAASIMLYASYYLFELKWRKYLIIWFATIFIHFSTFLLIVPFSLFYLYLRNKQSFYIGLAVLIIISRLMITALDAIPMFARYNSYIEAGLMENSIGFMQIAICIPLFLIYLYAKQKLGETIYVKALFVFTCSSLFLGILSYKIMMIGRALVYYNVIYIILIPIIFKLCTLKRSSYIELIKFAYMLYISFRFYDYLKTYLYMDGIMPYKSIF